MSDRGTITLPLRAFYARDLEHEKRRSEFYARMHMVYGLTGWVTRKVAISQTDQLGFAGMPPVIKKHPRTSAITVNVNAAPFEWLQDGGYLQSAIDHSGAHLARVEAGQKFRSAAEGAEIGGLRSPNLEGAGGGSRGPTNLSDHKIDCMKRLGEWRSMMPPVVFAVLRDVLFMDQFQVIREASGRVRMDQIERVRYGLDVIAHDLDLITSTAFRARWSHLPGAPAGRKVAG